MRRFLIRLWLSGFVIGIFLVGWTPLPNKLLAMLEFQYTVPSGDFNRFVGVVVLGGKGRPIYASITREGIELFRVTDRMVWAAQLARDYSHLKILYTNGSLKSKQASTDAEKLACQSDHFFLSSGLVPSNLLFECEATNTRDNAVFSAKLLGGEVSQPWLLLTSAAHMPRAMATFIQIGWNVTAYPVDYSSNGSLSWFDFSLVDGAILWHKFVYELFAWVKYYVLKWV